MLEYVSGKSKGVVATEGFIRSVGAMVAAFVTKNPNPYEKARQTMALEKSFDEVIELIARRAPQAMLVFAEMRKDSEIHSVLPVRPGHVDPDDTKRIEKECYQKAVKIQETAKFPVEFGLVIGALVGPLYKHLHTFTAEYTRYLLGRTAKADQKEMELIDRMRREILSLKNSNDQSSEELQKKGNECKEALAKLQESNGEVLRLRQEHQEAIENANPIKHTGKVTVESLLKTNVAGRKLAPRVVSNNEVAGLGLSRKKVEKFLQGTRTKLQKPVHIRLQKVDSDAKKKEWLRK